MNGLFNIGLSGLMAAQTAINNTSHNVANAQTPNFIKIKTLFQERSYINHIGGGVDTISEKGTYSPLNINNYLADGEYNNTILSNTEPILNYINSLKIPEQISSLRSSLEEIANNPTSIQPRNQAISSKDDLINSFNNIEIFSNRIKDSINTQKNILANNLNNLMAQLGNAEQNGPTFNTILSEINKISGGVFNNNSLLINNKQYPLSKDSQISNTDVQLITTGSLGALNSLSNIIIPKIDSQINNIQESIATTLNTANTQGVDLNGNSGTEFMSISDPMLIAAADQSALLQPNSQNNINILSMISSFDTMNDSKNYQKTSSELTQLLNNTKTNKLTTDQFAQNWQSKWDQQNAVNLDEEAVNMVKFKAMYEANIKVIQAGDEMLKTLLDIG